MNTALTRQSLPDFIVSSTFIVFLYNKFSGNYRGGGYVQSFKG